MKWNDACDDRDGLLHYRALRARAPEGLTAKSDMVVTVVTTVPPFLHGTPTGRRTTPVGPFRIVWFPRGKIRYDRLGGE
jgi:hypothetical protein